MAKGDKSKPAGRQKQRGGQAEEEHEKRGATHGGGKPGADRAKDEDKAPYRKGGKGGQH